jgi:hypothetical protein
MADAVNRTTIIEQKIRELEGKCSILEAEVLRSKKRQSPKPETISQEQSRPATRGRKRRYTAMLNRADTIIVSV